MDVNIEKIKRLNDMVSLNFKRKHTIILNPEGQENNKEVLEKNIEYDKKEWKTTEEINKLVDELSKNNNLSIEDKILLIFEKVCKDYVYDDNLISYIKKIDDDTFSLPDWYGRDIDDEWEKNRENHNRRICFELSRYIAKALTELLENNKDYNVCIHWNKDLTHYFVGLTCKEYSITIDPDDFFNIKDLTRIKANLTAEGITILEDNNNKFKKALDIFNSGRSKFAIKKIEEDINNSTNILENEEIDNNEDVTFLKKVMEILSKKYKMDSQGIFEYMKEIVDIRLGSEKREKIWKKIEGNTKESTRYIRCLVLNIDNQKVLIDVDKQILRPFSEEELNKKRTSFINYNDLSRGNFDYYNGL